VIHEGLGGRPCASLTAIDCQKVRRILDAPPQHRLAEFGHETLVAQGGLHPDRPARQITQAAHPVKELVDVGDVRMTVRADGILALGYAADSGDLGRHLRARQDTALSGFGALAEFDLEMRACWLKESGSNRPSGVRQPK